jgi:hypothetical protein
MALSASPFAAKLTFKDQIKGEMLNESPHTPAAQALEEQWAEQYARVLSVFTAPGMASLCPHIETKPSEYLAATVPMVSELAKTRLDLLEARAAAAGAAAKAAAAKAKAKILAGVVARIDAHLTNGDGDMSASIGAALAALGGKVVTAASAKNTHLIFLAGKPATFDAARKGNVLIVGTGWVDACTEAGRRLSESDFPVDEPPREDVGAAAAAADGATAAPKQRLSLSKHKKGASMVPRAAASAVDPNSTRFSSSQAHPETARGPLRERNAAPAPAAARTPVGGKRAAAAAADAPAVLAPASPSTAEPRAPRAKPDKPSPSPAAARGKKRAADAQPDAREAARTAKAAKPAAAAAAAARGADAPKGRAAAKAAAAPTEKAGAPAKTAAAAAKASAATGAAASEAGGSGLVIGVSGLDDESNTRALVATLCDAMAKKGSAMRGFELVTAPGASLRPLSVLIADAPLRRTVKVLLALRRGVPVVPSSWLLASFEAGRWLSTAPFELGALPAGAAPLGGRSVFVEGEAPIGSELPRNVLVKLVAECGGARATRARPRRGAREGAAASEGARGVSALGARLSGWPWPCASVSRRPSLTHPIAFSQARPKRRACFASHPPDPSRTRPHATLARARARPRPPGCACRRRRQDGRVRTRRGRLDRALGRQARRQGRRAQPRRRRRRRAAGRLALRRRLRAGRPQRQGRALPRVLARGRLQEARRAKAAARRRARARARARAGEGGEGGRRRRRRRRRERRRRGGLGGRQRRGKVGGSQRDGRRRGQRLGRVLN